MKQQYILLKSLQLHELTYNTAYFVHVIQPDEWTIAIFHESTFQYVRNGEPRIPHSGIDAVYQLPQGDEYSTMTMNYELSLHISET